MAEGAPAKRKPRIRKSAPTVRERAEQAKAKEDTKRPSRLRKLLSYLVWPFKKLRLRERRVMRPVFGLLRLIKRGLIWITPSYFINSWREVRQVVWPSRKETWRLTLAVFIFAIVFGALVAGVDRALDEVFKKVVLK